MDLLILKFPEGGTMTRVNEPSITILTTCDIGLLQFKLLVSTSLVRT